MRTFTRLTAVAAFSMISAAAFAQGAASPGSAGGSAGGSDAQAGRSMAYVYGKNGWVARPVTNEAHRTLLSRGQRVERPMVYYRSADGWFAVPDRAMAGGAMLSDELSNDNADGQGGK